MKTNLINKSINKYHFHIQPVVFSYLGKRLFIVNLADEKQLIAIIQTYSTEVISIWQLFILKTCADKKTTEAVRSDLMKNKYL